MRQVPSTSHSASPTSKSILRTLGENVRALRASLNWSTVEFALHAKISRKQLYRIETAAHATVRLSTVETLAQALGVQPAVLLSDGAKPKLPWAGEGVALAVSQRVRASREARQETQGVFANAAGIPRETLSRLENGARDVTLKLLDCIATELGITVPQLIMM